MSEFNELNWKNALTSLYQRSIEDPAYRELCLSDPVAAIKEVSDIELPLGVKLQFFDKRADFVYAFLLPPVPDNRGANADQIQEIIRWSTICTDFTTTVTGADQ